MAGNAKIAGCAAIAGPGRPDRVLRLAGTPVSPSAIPVINRGTRAFPAPCTSFTFSPLDKFISFKLFFFDVSAQSGAVKLIAIRSEK